MSDGIKNGQQDGLNSAAREEIGAYVTKIGQKRRSALFIITGATSSTVERPTRSPAAAKLNRFDNFLRATYSASDACIRYVEEAHCIQLFAFQQMHK